MCAIPEEKRPDVCRVISRCTKTPFDTTDKDRSARVSAADWAQVRSKLIDKTGLTQKQADDLCVFTSLPHDIDAALALVDEVCPSCPLTPHARACH